MNVGSIRPTHIHTYTHTHGQHFMHACTHDYAATHMHPSHIHMHTYAHTTEDASADGQDETASTN
jgi:hypothetical protein